MGSRVGRKPIDIPKGVEVRIVGETVVIKGSKGELTQVVSPKVKVTMDENQLLVAANQKENVDALVGTTRALLNNNVKGVTEGFKKSLQLVGVGYRAQLGKGKEGRTTIGLTLGLSHPVEYLVPKGIEVKSAIPTELEISGLCKQIVGQVAAEIRGICKGIRQPETYKGKGIRYADERILLKETKKK